MENVIESIESEVSKLLNESLEESAKNLNMAAAGYDEGWYAGEMNAYEKVFNLIEKIKEKDLEASKRVIGYDDFGKPLHEGDFCTFDVNAADWRFKPDNIRKSGLATLEGQVTYDEQDKCFELSIDNEYCPALYFHTIEPGTLSVKETKEQIKDDIRIEPDKINFQMRTHVRLPDYLHPLNLIRLWGYILRRAMNLLLVLIIMQDYRIRMNLML